MHRRTSGLAVGLYLAVGAILALHLAFLTRYPRVMIDEAWNSNTAWTWLTTGVPFDSIHSGTLDRFGSEWIRRPYLGTLPWVAAFAVGGLGLAQARFVAWLFGLGLVILTALVGRRGYDARVGALAALLLAVSPAFTQASHWARQDGMLALLVLVAFAIACRALDGERRVPHFLGGLVLGVSVDVHQNALLFVPGLMMLYVEAYGRAVLARRETWLAVLGASTGIGLYLVGHVFPDPDAYAALFRYHFTETHRLPILELAGLPRSFYGELGRFGFLSDGLTPALLAAAVAVLYRRNATYDRRVLVYASSAFVCFGLFAGAKYNYYAIQLSPFIALAIASALVTVLDEIPERSTARCFLALLLVAAIAYPSARMISGALARRHYHYYATADRIRAAIPPGANVMALPTWWLGLADERFASTLNLFYERFHTGGTFAQALHRFRPDVLVVEEHTRRWLSERGELGELERILGAQAVLDTSFSDPADPWHGRIELYRIHWPDAAEGG